MIFDTHTHLNSQQFSGRVEAELAFAKTQGVTQFNVVGFDRPTIEQSLVLSQRYPEIYSTLGWHPTEAASYDETIESWLLTQLQTKKVVAVGEIGLDYHWMTAPKVTQQAVFARQIALSKQVDLPFVVHTREAMGDTYDLIKKEQVGPRGGIMHSFSGSYEEAKQFIDLGMMISLSGVVTFKKAQDVQEVAKQIPLDYLLVETDAPYLAPVPYRGKENRPGYVRQVVEMIANLRGTTTEEIARVTFDNARRVFQLED